MLRRVLPALAAACVLATPGVAQLSVQSYTMRNGGTGSAAYWDAGYSTGSSQTVSNALLQGGVGKLTDGVIATDRWDVVSNSAGTGQYVGWYIGSNPATVPVITTFFSQSYLFTRLRLWVDHAAGYGGVEPPLSVIVGGTANAAWTDMTGGFSFTVTPPVGSAPFLIDLDLTSLNLSGTSLTFQVTHKASAWVMMSEMAVNGSALSVVPEPATVTLELVGLAMLGVAWRQKKRRTM
ncbi:MAG: PEP-CTERM sorting domain-containing protein [Gemmatimonadaceae bacterium]|nr:PEP-CTERM sorting domain-containing protein [Gemmatimonadaceae bacterium]